MRAIVLLLLAAAMALVALPASAMTFKFAMTGDGLKVIVASGEVRRGDARKLVRALEQADRDRHGTKRLYLDSEGGLVIEALDMADIMREAGVSTIVRKGSMCASACASILFVAGKYRTVERGGLLAIHSCYDARSGKAATECNAMISQHAEVSGVSGVTMMALQEAAGSDMMLVFEAEDAACFGLSLKPGARPNKRLPPCMRDAIRVRR